MAWVGQEIQSRIVASLAARIDPRTNTIDMVPTLDLYHALSAFPESSTVNNISTRIVDILSGLPFQESAPQWWIVSDSKDKVRLELSLKRDFEPAELSTLHCVMPNPVKIKTPRGKPLSIPAWHTEKKIREEDHPESIKIGLELYTKKTLERLLNLSWRIKNLPEEEQTSTLLLTKNFADRVL